jgi:hypothetical protein
MARRASAWIANYNDHDIFATPDARSTPFTTEFAVFYHVNGQTFWDNNGGQNYTLQSFRTLVGSDVAHRRSEVRAAGAWYERVVSGRLYVNNLSYRKNVGVRLSPAPGVWIDVPARYAGATTEGTYANSGIAEIWEYTSSLLNPQGGVIRLAAYYHNIDSGATAWDNNFGMDYAVSSTPRSVIE